MKTHLCISVFLITQLICTTLIAQDTTYWQQEINYSIQVTLNTEKKTLQGKETIEYTNHSPDTLYFIWFHLWPNAYVSSKTAYAKQYGSTFVPANKGFIDRLAFTANDRSAEIVPHETHPDIIKILLPEPLLPKQTVTIHTPFFVQLPRYTSRLGYEKNDFYISQWYPKPAAYDRFGWHPMPYQDKGEFYSDFGNFTVEITVPSDYVIAATGALQNVTEIEAYKRLGLINTIKAAEFYKPLIDSSHKTLLFRQHNIHDFAWFASKDFIIRYLPLQMDQKHMIDVFTFSKSKSGSFWQKAGTRIAETIVEMSKRTTPYPYSVISAVEGPFNRFSGGMEYPAICLINSADEHVLTHEVIHNWFYGIIATNERKHPWMDEGFTEWFAMDIYNMDVPMVDSYADVIDQEADAYDDIQAYAMATYLKAARWLNLLRLEMGSDAFYKGMKQYSEKWKFRHPYPADFKEVMEAVSGKNLNFMFRYLKVSGRL